MTRRDETSPHAPSSAQPVPNRGLPLIGNSAAIHDIRCTIARIAMGDTSVLITGESGVGKEVVARFVHMHSRRAARPMVAVNCAGVPGTLLQAELFGQFQHGLFGASRKEPGKLQEAHGGTIFLDEIDEMSPQVQKLLLRFLENGELQPIGATVGYRRVAVRLVTATNRDLMTLVRERRFREDLLYRLNVVHIEVPPLRERREDIPALIAHLCTCIGKPLTFSPAALRALETYHWPGNGRELYNTIERLSWTVASEDCQLSDLPDAIRANATTRGAATAGERTRPPTRWNACGSTMGD
jgi:DNA-binding NtrC family response regulator